MKNKYFLILWLLFGYVLMNAIDAVINFFGYAYFHLGLELEILPYYIKWTTFILCLFIFDLTCIFVLKYIDKLSVNKGFLQQKSSIFLVIFAAIIAVFLKPLTRLIDDWHLKKLVNAPINEDYMSELNISNLYQNLNITLAVCSWSILIILTIYCLYSYNKTS